MRHITKPLIPLFLLIVVACNKMPSQKKDKSEASVSIANQLPNELRSFDYQPQKPQGGSLYAVIELGSVGLNYFIIDLDKQSRWELVKSKYGVSDIIYGAKTAKKLLPDIKQYQREIRAAGVSSSNIYYVASSSVVRTDDLEKINNTLSPLNASFKPVSSTDEAILALHATIPSEFIEESFLVDVGSGNTKLSWLSSDADTLGIEIHGSKYFLGGTQDTTVFREVRDAVLEVPAKNRNLCFMLGGTIYEFVKDEAQKTDDRYVLLKPPSAYPKTTDELKAGNVIYSALFLEPTYSYIFDTQSNFAIGYLLDKRRKREN